MQKVLPKAGKWLMVMALCGMYFSASAQNLATIQPLKKQNRGQLQSSGKKALELVLSEIEKEHGVRFSFDPAVVNNKQVEVKSKQEEPKDLEGKLKNVLQPLHLTYKEIDENFFVIEAEAGTEAQMPVPRQTPDAYLQSSLSPVQSANMLPKQRAAIEKNITGKVTDENGTGLPGVSILVKNTTIGTVTDVEGNYRLSVPDDATTLVFTSVGYVAEEVTIGGQSVLDVQLLPDIQSLNEVVVVGYGTQERSDLTGSISSIKTEEIAGQAFTNVEQAMQGKVPGVQVNYASGEPGSPMQVQIRGIGTFGNSDPLYVVDGVPMKAEDMATINPNNIESMEILKDASAAAIYGARAANGVVLITTAGGEEGKMQLDYNGYYGLQSFTDFIPMLNSQQYAALNNESTAASGYAPEPAFNNPENLLVNTNWQEEAFRTAPMTNHSLRISGGSETATYSVSGDYLSQEGIMVFNNLERFSTNINTRFKVTDRITLGESLNISRTSGLNRHQGNNLDFTYMLGGSPTMRIYRPENEGGYAGPNAAETGVNNRDNIVGRRDLRRTYDESTRILGNFFAEYNILPELKYRFNFGINLLSSDLNSYIPVYEMDNRTNRQATLTDTRSETNYYLLENLLSYDKDFGNDVSLSLLAGYTEESSAYSFLTGNIQEFPSNELQVIDAGTGAFTIAGNESEWAIRSLLARAHVTLYDKYLFTATIRRDGSSRFGSETRYGNFPSVALGWNISRESFMDNVNFIDEMKVRASWGRLGNQDLGDNNYVNQTTVSTVPRYILGNAIAPAASVVTLGNPALRWESTTQTDIGVDMELFNSKLVVYADYYIKNTEDVLLRVPISSATGIDRNNGPYQNAAAIRNSGFEFQLTYRKSAGDLSYNISGNLATMSNEVTSLGGQSAIINFPVNAYNYGSYTYTTVGLPMSSYYGYIADGIFQNQGEVDAHAEQPGAAAGDVRFRDLNGDNVINADDRTILGDPFPDFTYGFSGNLNYKNIDVNISFQGVQGRDLYNAQRAFLESSNGEHNQMATTLNRWTGEGTSYTMPRAVRDDPNDNARPSTRFVEDASYLRLQNLQIGYTFPEEMMNSINIRKLRVYFNGQNLLTLTGYTNYTPDVRGGGGWAETEGNPLSIGVDTGTYPLPRVFQLGVQLGL